MGQIKISNCEICGIKTEELFLNKNNKWACAKCKDSQYYRCGSGFISDEENRINRLNKKHNGVFVEARTTNTPGECF